MSSSRADELRQELLRRELTNRQGSQPVRKQVQPQVDNDSGMVDKLFNPVTNVKNLAHGVQDIAGGALGGAQRLGSTIGEAVEYPTHAAYEAITGDKVPHFPVRQFMGLAGDNQFDLNKVISHDPNSIASKLGQYAPILASGIGSIPRAVAASGLWGAIQAEPDQQNAMGLLPSGRIGGGLADAAMVGAGGAALKYAPPIARYLKGSASDTIGAAKNLLKTAKEVPGELPPVPELSGLKLPDPEPMPIMGSSTAPQTSDELINKLGLGSKNKEEGATKLASMIREKHDQRKEQAAQFFKYVMNTAGKNKLYEHVDPLISTSLNKEMPMMEKLKGLDVKPLYEKFKASPTIENAHWLKSELGTVIGDLEKNTAKSVGDRAVISNINGVRKTLDYDIRDALKRHDMSSNDNISPMYDLGVDLHNAHVEPFRSTPSLRDITIKGVETPKNIENIFDTPTNIVKRGKSTIGPINKVISDLPEEAKDLILFNKIGALKHIGEPDKILNSLNSAKNEGFSSYFNPHVNESIESISKKLAEEKEAKLNYLSKVKETSDRNKKMASEVKSEHVTKQKQALLQHKLDMAKINERNRKIEEAKKIKKYVTAGLAATVFGTGLGGLYRMKNRIENAQSE